MSILTDVVAEFTPENEHALLFFEMANTAHELTFLLAKLEDLVEQRINYTVFRGTTSSVILLRLMPQKAMEATLMLSEFGLNDLMVLYPHPNKSQRKGALEKSNLKKTSENNFDSGA